MKKRFLRMATSLLITAVILSLFVAPALADNLDFTAVLSITNRSVNYVGDEVEFSVKIVNTGTMGIGGIKVYNTRGSTAIGSYGSLGIGESAIIPVKKVFSAAGEFGVKFKVVGTRVNIEKTVETNTVTVTINNPPTPTPEPTPEPTPQPTPEPTQTPTPEPSPTQMPEPTPTSSAEPAESAVLNEDEDGGQTEPPMAQPEAISADTLPEPESKSNTVLYIIIAVIGAALLAAIAIILIMQKKGIGKGKQ